MSLRQQDFRVRRCWETRLKFRLERMDWQKDSRGVSSRPMPFSERGSRRKRVWRQTRTRLGADSVAFGSRFGRLWELIRSWMGRCSLTNTDSVLSISLRCWKPPFSGCAKYRISFSVLPISFSALPISFSALPILKVNSISIKHRRRGMAPRLPCSWDD